MKMWLTHWPCDNIWVVEVERVSEAFVWIGGKRHYKCAGHREYHATWGAAHEHLLHLVKCDLKDAEIGYAYAAARWKRLKAMKRVDALSQSVAPAGSA